MKKSLLAIAALSAIAGAASAQTNVTLFGVADANYQRAKASGNTVDRLNGAGSNASSRLGFKGVEDLGGGLAASFWYEAGVNVDSGTGGGTSLNNQAAAAGTGNAGLTFNRRSTVSLNASWGEVRLGRDYTPTFWNLTMYDPFGTVGAGAATNIQLSNITNTTRSAVASQSSVRASNSVQYIYQGCGYDHPAPCTTGLYVQGMYAMGENPSNAAAGTKNDGRYTGLRVGYGMGPWHFAVASAKVNAAAGDITQTNVGAAYNLGVANLMAQYYSDKSSAAGTSKFSGFMLGATIPAGPGYIPVTYHWSKLNSSPNLKANQLAVGYVYNLSKRTNLYATYSRIANSNAAVSGGGVVPNTGDSWSGLDIGIKHSF